jgi:hypothetical protein
VQTGSKSGGKNAAKEVVLADVTPSQPTSFLLSDLPDVSRDFKQLRQQA